jgi:hypothetical protein
MGSGNVADRRPLGEICIFRNYLRRAHPALRASGSHKERIMATIFYKYRNVNEDTKDSLVNHYFYYAQPFELNDPFDCRIPQDYNATEIEISKWIKEHSTIKVNVEKLQNDIANGKLDELMSRTIKDLESRHFIFCLSSVWDESLMWANYANSNKGICIGYKTVYEESTCLLEILKTNSNSTTMIEKQDNKLCPLVDVKYSKSKMIPFNPFKKNYDAIKNGFFYKEAKWAFEKEYRSVLVNAGNDEFSKKIIFPKNVLKEIIFGENAKISDIRDIIRIIRKNYPNGVRLYSIRTDNINMKYNRLEITDEMIRKYYL